MKLASPVSSRRRVHAAAVVMAMLATACSADNTSQPSTTANPAAATITIVGIDAPSEPVDGAPLVIDVDPGSHGIDTMYVYPADEQGNTDTIVETVTDGSYLLTYTDDSLVISDATGAWWEISIAGDEATMRWLDEDGVEGSAVTDVLDLSAPEAAADPIKRSAGRSILGRRAMMRQAESPTVPVARTVRIPIRWKGTNGSIEGTAGSAAVADDYCSDGLDSVELPSGVSSITCSAQPQVGYGAVTIVYQAHVDIRERIEQTSQTEVDNVDRQCSDFLELGPNVLNGIGGAATLAGAAATFFWPVTAPVAVLIAAAGVLGLVGGIITSPSNADRIKCRAYVIGNQVGDDLRKLTVPGPTLHGQLVFAELVPSGPTEVQLGDLKPFVAPQLAEVEFGFTIPSALTEDPEPEPVSDPPNDAFPWVYEGLGTTFGAITMGFGAGQEVSWQHPMKLTIVLNEDGTIEYASELTEIPATKHLANCTNGQIAELGNEDGTLSTDVYAGSYGDGTIQVQTPGTLAFEGTYTAEELVIGYETTSTSNCDGAGEVIYSGGVSFTIPRVQP